MPKKNAVIGVIIFLTGAVTMIYEIAGSRVLGPYLGTTVFVWTSLIGIIMGSLSIGYWAGGRLSVSRSDLRWLTVIISLAAFCILSTAIINNYVLVRLIKYIPTLRLRSIIAVIILFAPAGVFLGMILPYSVRIVIGEISRSGSTVGKLYALSTTGSIVGTFLAGFYLIPTFGFKQVILSISVLLLSLTALLLIKNKYHLIHLFPAVVLTITVIFWIRTSGKTLDYVDKDTEYNRVLIYETKDKATGRPIRMLNVNNENSSAIFLDNGNGLVFEVLKYYHLVRYFVPDFKECLMIGGSGYAFPRNYLSQYPDAKIDVVEIDPGLTALAKKYFDLKPNDRLTIHHEDGRTFLNRNEKKYDAIFMDAYKSLLTIPFQLTTKEAVEDIYHSLKDKGAVFANIISPLVKGRNDFLLAETATYRSVFPKVLLFAVQYPHPDEEQMKKFQNFMLVGLKSGVNPSQSSSDSLLNEFLKHRIRISLPDNTMILTDEYAPVEYLTGKNID